MKPPWKRVNREKPCPICERPDWCLISDDGTAAICARTDSPKRCGEAGWLHRLVDDDRQRPRRYVRTISTSATIGGIDFPKLARDFQGAVNLHDLDHLARGLGLSVDSLHTLGIGWSIAHRAWSFPMVNADGNVVGIRLRRLDGSKFSVKGGKEGVFMPSTIISGDSRLIICEGPTDAAALLDLGFENVIGRPSCTGGIKIMVALVRRWKTPAVVIVADGDEPGQRGANNLGSVLLCYVPVQVIVPPAGIKDSRQWLRAGGTRADVEQAIRAAPVRRLQLTGAR